MPILLRGVWPVIRRIGMKKWIVRLEAEERKRLEQLVGVGKAAAYKIRHAHMLLAVDESEAGPKLEDAAVAKALNITVRSIEMLRRRFVEEGLEACLVHKNRGMPSEKRKFDGAKEAKLIALACGAAPKGRARWTLELLADRVVQLGIVESCATETIRQTLKKTS